MRKNLYMRKLFFIIGIMASVAGCSFGASAEVYSLDSCRQMALTSNKEMMVKAEKVRQAHYTRKEAFAAYLPAFDFTGGYFYNQNGQPLSSLNGTIATDGIMGENHLHATSTRKA